MPMPRFCTGVLLLLFSVSCGGSPAGPRAGDIVTISGAVQDFSTGAAVPGATVRFGEASAATNGSGVYQIGVPVLESYTPTVDGVRVGNSSVFGEGYRGDFLIRPGTCVARYGTVSDLGLHRPISGATVSLGGKQTVTGADGWYRLDFGCPSNGLVGSNTTFIYATHPTHADASRIIGRGVDGVYRLDIDMERKK
jgi:hypothetical protein